ncbi:hypothetical protein PGB90_006750 [Kerria lacca]
MKLLQKSCCGCTVKTGALVICNLTLIQAVVIVLEILSNRSPVEGKEVVFLNAIHRRDLSWYAVCSIIIVAHALFGIYKKKPGYMVPFLIYKLMMLFCLILTLAFAKSIIETIKISLPNENEDDVLPYFVITLLLTITLQAYALLILFSHYQNVRQEIREAANINSIGFTAPVPDAEASLRYPTPYDNEGAKKQPPPPYAV